MTHQKLMNTLEEKIKGNFAYQCVIFLITCKQTCNSNLRQVDQGKLHLLHNIHICKYNKKLRVYYSKVLNKHFPFILCNITNCDIRK